MDFSKNLKENVKIRGYIKCFQRMCTMLCWVLELKKYDHVIRIYTINSPANKIIYEDTNLCQGHVCCICTCGYKNMAVIAFS